MSSPSPTVMPADEAASVLEKSLDPKGKLTIADAAEKSGLALRDARSGLFALVAKYRGHLSTTEEGEILFSFPTGFSQPWVIRGALSRGWDRVSHALLGVARFVVRAWVAIVLVGYALIFLAILIAMATQQRGDSKRSSSGLGGVGFLFRIVADAIFWTWRPWSPFSYGYGYGYGDGYSQRAVRADDGPKVPFYQKVDQFFFGPTEKQPDPREIEKKIISEIRFQKGRVGVGDVMRVTGIPRGEADAYMSKLMLDYDGEVEVSEEGAIFYKFPTLRLTTEVIRPVNTPAKKRWAKLKELPPLTGNPMGSNLAVIALNGFNLLMSWFAIANDLTIHRLTLLLSKVPLQRIPLEGTPIALGLVPLIFSLALFALPLFRLAVRPFKARALKRENARLAIRRAALASAGKGGITEEEMSAAVEKAAEGPVDKKLVNEELAKLGGDVDNDAAGKVRYRFPDFEREAKTLEAEREAAAEEEANPGRVIFSTEN